MSCLIAFEWDALPFDDITFSDGYVYTSRTLRVMCAEPVFGKYRIVYCLTGMPGYVSLPERDSPPRVRFEFDLDEAATVAPLRVYCDGELQAVEPTAAGSTGPCSSFPYWAPELVLSQDLLPRFEVQGVEAVETANGVRLAQAQGSGVAVLPDGTQYILRRNLQATSDARAEWHTYAWWVRATADAAWTHLPGCSGEEAIGRLFPLLRCGGGVSRVGYGRLLDQNPCRQGSTAEWGMLPPDGPFTSTELYIAAGREIWLRLATFCTLADVRADGDAWGLAAGYDQSRDRQNIVAVQPNGTTVVVAEDLRAPGANLGRPWPWVDRLPSGEYCIGTFCDGCYHEWRSRDDAGSAWQTVESGALVTGSDLTCGCYRAGRDGTQVVAGCHQNGDLSGEIRMLWRAGWGQPWQGPVVVATTRVVTQPYVLDRCDGMWEVGWLLDDTWSCYRATVPGGAWSTA